MAGQTHEKMAQMITLIVSYWGKGNNFKIKTQNSKIKGKNEKVKSWTNEIKSL